MRRLPRTRFPSRLLVLLAVALGLAACGDDGPTSDPAPVAEAPTPETPAPEAPASAPHPIRFVHGLAAGIEAAGDPDALLFVYVARHHPT